MKDKVSGFKPEWTSRPRNKFSLSRWALGVDGVLKGATPYRRESLLCGSASWEKVRFARIRQQMAEVNNSL